MNNRCETYNVEFKFIQLPLDRSRGGFYSPKLNARLKYSIPS